MVCLIEFVAFVLKQEEVALGSNLRKEITPWMILYPHSSMMHGGL